MLIYADGGALARAFVDSPESDAWRELVRTAGDRLVTSPLGLTELRRVADPLGPRAREAARELAGRTTVLRFSDQAVKSAAMASSAAPPFTAMHIGIAASDPDVDTVATYDLLLARMAVIYGLAVLSPGRPDRWWEG
ncbi:PIN domain-containing protein [Actinotalea sp. M2MS4P-6]|uniref:PIN domain-containing protein n=1 Tax=Actinotalea sp. M2MS4P-6 TaxID=2983762 RepID=UPI0021E3826B|nr:PIN domain-containing protein [Actinotalea sp. M2MS4P-6]MCV2395976.1 PIN domain-containing protein [Actinotalea sp. M2MS4P-6]